MCTLRQHLPSECRMLTCLPPSQAKAMGLAPSASVVTPAAKPAAAEATPVAAPAAPVAKKAPASSPVSRRAEPPAQAPKPAPALASVTMQSDEFLYSELRVRAAAGPTPSAHQMKAAKNKVLGGAATRPQAAVRKQIREWHIWQPPSRGVLSSSSSGLRRSARREQGAQLRGESPDSTKVAGIPPMGAPPLPPAQIRQEAAPRTAAAPSRVPGGAAQALAQGDRAVSSSAAASSAFAGAAAGASWDVLRGEDRSETLRVLPSSLPRLEVFPYQGAEATLVRALLATPLHSSEMESPSVCPGPTLHAFRLNAVWSCDSQRAVKGVAESPPLPPLPGAAHSWPQEPQTYQKLRKVVCGRVKCCEFCRARARALCWHRGHQKHCELL